MRTAVLLGAGASADAGLPLTNELAAALVKGLTPVHASRAEIAALNFIYGAMVSAVTDRGGDPFAAVNAETMISAVRLLRDRATHEAAPFVQWKPQVNALDVKHDRDLDIESRLAQAVEEIGNEEGGRSLHEALLDVIDDRTGSGGDGRIYESLERQLRDMLASILYLTKEVEYLYPLIDLATTQPGGVDIATLNYDLGVERAAAEREVPVRRGIDEWRPGTDLEFPAEDGVVNLVKLHGSIDWVIETLDEEIAPLPQKYARVRNRPEQGGNGPAIVIGDREKLETEGPTLALLRSFEVALRLADRLVIVGYAGGDAHVNAIIRDWVNARDDRTVTALDPSWPVRERGTFRAELNERLGGGEGRPNRLRIIRARAKEGLALALEALPETAPPHQFEATAVMRDGSKVEVTVTNVGLDIARVEFMPSNARTFEINRKDLVRGTSSRSLRLPWMPTGDTVSILIGYSDSAEASDWTLDIWALRGTGSVRETLSGTFGPNGDD